MGSQVTLVIMSPSHRAGSASPGKPWHTWTSHTIMPPRTHGSPSITSSASSCDRVMIATPARVSEPTGQRIATGAEDRAGPETVRAACRRRHADHADRQPGSGDRQCMEQRTAGRQRPLTRGPGVTRRGLRCWKWTFIRNSLIRGHVLDRGQARVFCRSPFSSTFQYTSPLEAASERALCVIRRCYGFTPAGHFERQCARQNLARAQQRACEGVVVARAGAAGNILSACAFLARRIDELDAFLLAFDQDAAYDSPNFLWFRERYPRFVYVDRVVVAGGGAWAGLARRLYRDLFEQCDRPATTAWSARSTSVRRIRRRTPSMPHWDLSKWAARSVHEGRKTVRYLSAWAG